MNILEVYSFLNVHLFKTMIFFIIKKWLFVNILLFIGRITKCFGIKTAGKFNFY